MAGRKDICELGKRTRFSSTNPPKNPGRKPSLYNHIKKLLGTEAKAELSKEDYFKLIQFLLEQPLDNLKKLADSKNTPIWIVGVVRSVVKDANAGRTTTLDSLFDRLFGKASQPLTGKDGETLFPPRTLTPQEAKEYGLKIEEEY